MSTEYRDGSKVALVLDAGILHTFKRLILTRECGVLAALIVVFLWFAFSSPVFMTPNNLINLLRQVSLLGVLAVGATFVLIISEVDLSVGSLYGLSGMLYGMLLLVDMPELIVLAIVLLLGAMIGCLNGLITVMGRIPSFITTLGMLYLVRGSTLVMSDGMPVSLPDGAGLGQIIIFLAQGSLIAGLSNQVLIMLAMAGLGFIVLHRTTFGFHIFAVGDNDKAARIIGVPVTRTKILAFALAGLLAAFAGAINFGFLENVQPVTGMGLELDVIAAVIIGGTRLGGGEGSIIGTLLGVLLIGIVRNGLVLLGVTSFWQMTLIGAVVLAAALIGGLTSKKQT